jgi:hypothetical protein
MEGQGTFVWSTGERYDGGWKVRAYACVPAGQPLGHRSPAPVGPCGGARPALQPT